MAAHEQSARLAALTGTDAEQGKKSGAWNEHVEQRRQKGAEKQSLRHGTSLRVESHSTLRCRFRQDGGRAFEGYCRFHQAARQAATVEAASAGE
ncbi:hypothetical protein LJR255_001622 [Pararhizobium sp. LjRoot255]|uniref:hypothetical protein n=1 Tax=Pararhizobium sp. LjRoot255 TaxID=3342298 RepID=UPI003ECDAAA6